MKISYFGDIDSGNLEEYYDAQVDLDGLNIELDINIDPSVGIDWVDGLEKYLQQLSVYHAACRADIERFKNEEGTVKELLSFYEEDLEPEMLDEILRVVMPRYQYVTG